MPEWIEEPWEEPVTCSECGKTHELQDSYFCPVVGCYEGKGLCHRCKLAHQEFHYGPQD